MHTPSQEDGDETGHLSGFRVCVFRLKYVEIARALGDNSQAYPQSAPTPNTRYVLLLRKLGVPRQPAGIQETLLGAEAVTGLEGCKHRGTRNKLPHGSRMELVTCFFGGKSRSMYLQPGLMSCTHKNTYVLIYIYIYTAPNTTPFGYIQYKATIPTGAVIFQGTQHVIGGW